MPLFRTHHLQTLYLCVIVVVVFNCAIVVNSKTGRTSFNGITEEKETSYSGNRFSPPKRRSAAKRNGRRLGNDQTTKESSDEKEPPSSNNNINNNSNNKKKDNSDTKTTTTTTIKGAIVVLTTNSANDLDNLCVALESFRYLPGDRHLAPSLRAPVLVFNEGNLDEQQLSFVRNCVTDGHRNVAFPIVRLNERFPEGFGNVADEWERYKSSVGIPSEQKWEGRPPAFSYANMIRFWTHILWTHPAVQQFETIMRMDTDSCLLRPLYDDGDDENSDSEIDERLRFLPFLPSKDVVYLSLGPGLGVTRHFYDVDTEVFRGASVRPVLKDVERNPDCRRRALGMRIQGLYDHFRDYVRRRGFEPTHAGMWNATIDAYEQFCILPTFETHFEVMRRDFFRSKPVSDWHESLSEREPFGVLRRRWGDAQTRFMTMAMFAPGDESVIVSSGQNDWYNHGRDYERPDREFKCRLSNAAAS